MQVCHKEWKECTNRMAEINKKIIAVFGGAFNPPTNSHLNLAKQILEKNKMVEKIIFVPVNVKYNKNGLASNEARFAMLKEICKNTKGLEVSSIELDSTRQLYTLETLRLIQKKYKNYDICFILGTDNLKTLETWYEADTLLKEFKFLVLERKDDKIEEIIEKNNFLELHKESIIKLSNIDKIDLSSTEIREKVKRGESIENLVPKEILSEVIELYK